MLRELFRKFGYVKLDTPQKPPVVADKHYTQHYTPHFKNDIVTLSFRKGEQVLIQTSNEKLLEVVNEMSELLKDNVNEVSISSIIDILYMLNLTLAIRNVIPK